MLFFFTQKGICQFCPCLYTKFYYVLFFFLINNAMMFVQPLPHICNYDKYDKVMIVNY